MKRKVKQCWRSTFLLFVMLCTYLGNASGQEIKITGIVSDNSSGEPLPGVTVVFEGTQHGTITDGQGVYEITVTSGTGVLTFSSIGFNAVSIEIAGRTVIDVQLMPALTELDEVVVIGYGTMRKKDLTGAVASVKTEDIEANKSHNALQALQGTVAGVDVLTSDGQAGSGININIRGIRSLSANNEPLVLVDGVEYGKTLDINTSDIESIDVLKDVASTAIYGAKGANGVILITTKRGTEGKTKVSYSNYFSYNMPTHLPHIMNGQEYQDKQYQVKIANEEYLRYYNEGGVRYDPSTGELFWDEVAQPEPWSVFGTVTLDELVTAGGKADKYELLTEDPTALELLRNDVSIDYLDLIMVNSWSQNHEITISGGTEKSALNLSLGLMDDNGLLRNDNMRRYNLNVGVDHYLSKSIKVGANIFYTYKKYEKRNGGIFNTALKCGPIGTLYNEDGTYNDIPDPVFAYNQISPMLDEVPGAQIRDIFTNRIFGSTYFNWEIIEGLNFRSNFGINLDLTREGRFNSANSLQQHTSRESRADLINEDQKSFTWNNILSYTKTLGVHNIQLMAGSEAFKYERSRSEMTGYNQPLETTEYYDFNGFTQDKRVYGSAFEERQLLSFFGRANYSMKERYLLQATLRYDGASQLYPGNKWELFPSVSAGWRISEESFMQNLNTLSNLKLRYSWGISGNYDIPPYSSQTKLSNELSYYTFGDEPPYAQYVPFRIGNSTLTWEKTASHNMGIDFGFFRNRLYGSLDYYNSQTKDLLYLVPLPLVNSYPKIWDNVAETKSQGIEVTLGGLIVNKNTVDWSADLNFAHNKSEVTALREGINELPYGDDSEKIWQVDGPADAHYVYENQGVYQIEDLRAELLYVSQQNATGDSIERGLIPMISNDFEPGDIKLTDQNGDGEFTPEDKIVVDASPKFIFGFGTNLNVKTKAGNIGLRIYAIGRLGQTIDYSFYERFKDSKDKTNSAYAETWTPQNTGATFPRFSEYGNNLSGIHKSSLRYVDGSFVKIKDITLSYTLPRAWSDKIKIESLQIYTTARNMITFSKLENYDPEQRGGFSFPLQKNWIFGLNIDF